MPLPLDLPAHVEPITGDVLPVRPTRRPLRVTRVWGALREEPMPWLGQQATGRTWRLEVEAAK